MEKPNINLILNAAEQVNDIKPLRESVLSLYDSLEKLYGKKKLGKTGRYCQEHNIKEKESFEKIAKVLSSHGDEFTHEFLLRIFSEYVAEKTERAAITGNGQKKEWEYFEKAMNALTARCISILEYMDMVLACDVGAIISKTIRERFGGSMSPTVNSIAETCGEMYDTLLEVRDSTRELIENRKFLADYENESKVYAYFQDILKDFKNFINWGLVKLFTICTPEHTCETIYTTGSKLVCVRGAEDLPSEPVDIKSIELPKSENLLDGLSSPAVLEAVNRVSQDREKKPINNVLKQTVETMWLEMFRQTANISVEIPDIVKMVCETELTQGERKFILNAAFRKADAESETGDYENQIQGIAKDIISAYLLLVMKKDRTETLKRLHNAGTKIPKQTAKTVPDLGEKYLALTEENKRLQSAIEKLKKSKDTKKDNLAEENKELHNQISQLNAKIRNLEAEIEEKESETKELHELLEESESETETVETISETDFRNLIAGEKIMLWGTTKAVEEKTADYPEITCIITEGRKKPNLTRNQIAGISGVVLMTNQCSHGMYWVARDTVKRAGIPYIHMKKSDTNIERIKSACADLTERIHAERGKQ